MTQTQTRGRRPARANRAAGQVAFLFDRRRRTDFDVDELAGIDDQVLDVLDDDDFDRIQTKRDLSAVLGDDRLTMETIRYDH